MHVVQLNSDEMKAPGLPKIKGGFKDRPVFKITGPIKKRELIDTLWGEAWAEVGTYIAENTETGDKHIVHPDDFGKTYRVVKQD